MLLIRWFYYNSYKGEKETEGYLKPRVSLNILWWFLLIFLNLLLIWLTKFSESTINGANYSTFWSNLNPIFLILLLLLLSFVWSWSIICCWSIPWLISIFLSKITSKEGLLFFFVFCTRLFLGGSIPFWVNASQFL